MLGPEGQYDQLDEPQKKIEDKKHIYNSKLIC